MDSENVRDTKKVAREVWTQQELDELAERTSEEMRNVMDVGVTPATLHCKASIVPPKLPRHRPHLLLQLALQLYRHAVHVLNHVLLIKTRTARVSNESNFVASRKRKQNCMIYLLVIDIC